MSVIITLTFCTGSAEDGGITKKKLPGFNLPDSFFFYLDMFLSSDNTQFRIINKVDNMLNLRTHRNLILNHQQSIENAALSLVNNTVSMTDMLNNFITYPLMGKYYGTDPVIGYRFLGGNNIRRYIFTDTATGLCHRPGTQTTSLAYQDIATENDIVFKKTVPGYFAAVT